jgi:L-asparaginase
MRELYGQYNEPLVLLHGGAGGQDPKSSEALAKASEALRLIAHKACSDLRAGVSPQDIVVSCLQAMECDEQFNAGRGAALQADGQARLTAALMNGSLGTFSGVIGATHINHPSLLAKHLQSQRARVLSSPGTELLARQLGLPVESSLSRKRVEQWQTRFLSGETFCDTVGVVVRTRTGDLFAGTSTGGRGYEFPGRVSDSATVAGTYASPFAAISATGIGEEIVDDALSARLETRCRDGLSLEEASKRCFLEAIDRKRSYGWIAVDRKGCWGIAHTTPAMSFIVCGTESGNISKT